MNSVEDQSHEPSLWQMAARTVIRIRWLGLMIAVVLFGFAWQARRDLQFDRRLETMFVEGDPTRSDFEFLKENFQGNEVLLCVFELDSLWEKDGEGLKALKQTREALEKIDGISSAMDLSKLNEMVGRFTAPSIFAKPDASPPILDPKNVLAKSFLELFSGYTHRRDSKVTAIACLLVPNASPIERQQTLDAIRQVLDSGPIHGEVVGELVMMLDGFRLVEEDGKRLGIAASVILAGLILIGFRSIRWTLIAVLVVQWSLVVTEGLIVWSGLQLTMVSSMLAAIVTVVGIATTIHWMIGYQDAFAKSKSSLQAIDDSLANLLKPIVGACLTDAIGFGALMIARVGPVRDYGLMMALASLVVLIGILLLIPGLATIGSLGNRLAVIPGDQWVRNWLTGSLQVVLRHKFLVVAFTIACLLLSLWGSLRMQVETDFIRNFREDWPMVRAYRLVESELGGAGVWDVLLPAPKTLTDDYLKSVLQLEAQLRTLEAPTEPPYRLTKVLSLADADLTAQSSALAKLLPASARIQMMQGAMPDFFGTMLSEPIGSRSTKWLRIMLRSPEQATADAKSRLLELVQSRVRDHLASPEWSKAFGSDTNEVPQNARVTGHFVLLTRLVESLIADQWRCFLVASIGIGLALWLAVRDWRWVLLAWIPNALPALVVLGGMGWLGWRMNLGAALIAAVSLGLSVDSSLHYLVRLRRRLDEGWDFRQAMMDCQEEVGLAMCISTLALMCGFGFLMTSEFLPTVVFGATASLTMLGGLIGNLWLLPTLIDTLGSKPSRLLGESTKLKNSPLPECLS